jgi:hypothetical protein
MARRLTFSRRSLFDPRTEKFTESIKNREASFALARPRLFCMVVVFLASRSRSHQGHMTLIPERKVFTVRRFSCDMGREQAWKTRIPQRGARTSPCPGS